MGSGEPSVHQEDKSDMFKFIMNLTVSGFRIYLNSNSEIYIPTNKWLQVKDREEELAMDPKVLINLMKQAFDAPSGSKKHQFITNKISEVKLHTSLYMPLETEESRKAGITNEGVNHYGCFVSLSNGLEFRLSPEVLNAISTFNGRCAIGILIKDLK